MAQNINQLRESNRAKVEQQLKGLQQEVRTLLPAFVPYDKFITTLWRALHAEPAILECEPRSIVKAVLQAAEGGYRIDKREGAIVPHDITIGANTPNQRKIKTAQFFPMAFGIYQHLMRSKEIYSINYDVIYAKDEYVVELGMDPKLIHKPFMTGPRGDILAAYSCAILANGGKQIEFLSREDLDKIKAAAKTKDVWNKWPGEMAKKSALRRHSKRLPYSTEFEFNPMEEGDDGRFDHLVGANMSNAAPALQQQQKARPTRQAIAHQPDNGVPLDLGDHDEHGELIERQQRAPAEQQQKKDAPPVEQAAQAEISMPHGDDEWRAWALDIEKRIAKAANENELTELAQAEEPRLRNPSCGEDRAAWVRGLISDRMTDFMSGAE